MSRMPRMKAAPTIRPNLKLPCLVMPSTYALCASRPFLVLVVIALSVNLRPRFSLPRVMCPVRDRRAVGHAAQRIRLLQEPAVAQGFERDSAALHDPRHPLGDRGAAQREGAGDVGLPLAVPEHALNERAVAC